MQKLIYSGLLILVTLSASFGQNRVTENNVLGQWKMVIDMDDIMDELDKEAEDSDNFLAETILSAVSGAVQGIIEEFDIYIELKRGGSAIITVAAFGEEGEEEGTKWYIDGGRLYLDDSNNEHVNWDGDDHWEMRDGVLHLEGGDDDDPKVYMVRMDD